MEATGLCHALFTQNKRDGKKKFIETQLVSMHVLLALR
jgi:hypothetical protein